MQFARSLTQADKNSVGEQAYSGVMETVVDLIQVHTSVSVRIITVFPISVAQ